MWHTVRKELSDQSMKNRALTATIKVCCRGWKRFIIKHLSILIINCDGLKKPQQIFPHEKYPAFICRRTEVKSGEDFTSNNKITSKKIAELQFFFPNEKKCLFRLYINSRPFLLGLKTPHHFIVLKHIPLQYQLLYVICSFILTELKKILMDIRFCSSCKSLY